MTTFTLFIKQFLARVDGSFEAKGVEISNDKAQAEEDRKSLETLFKLGKAGGRVADGSSLLLSELIAKYFEEAKEGKRLTEKTRQEVETTFNLFKEVVGDKPVNELTASDFVQLKEVLNKLPANRSKDKRYRDKKLTELMSMSIPEEDRLNIKTKNKLIQRVASLFNWAVSNHLVETNYAKGKTWATNKNAAADEAREPYTDEEARKLMGALESVSKPWQKWIVLIGLYQGMRLNEIAQLHLDDFIEQPCEGMANSVPCIDINKNNSAKTLKRLKNRASRRTIPIHPKLIEQGLLAHVKELRDKGVVRAWPELSAGRDGYGKRPSQWFNEELLPSLLVDNDFHALRHTVATKLREAGASTEDIADLLGHSRGSTQTASRYMKAASVKRLLAALSLLSYE